MPGTRWGWVTSWHRGSRNDSWAGCVSPKQVEERLLQAITVPTRSKPSISLEELDAEGVALRVNATPLRPEDGSQLAEEVLDALRREEPAESPASA